MSRLIFERDVRNLVPEARQSDKGGEKITRFLYRLECWPGLCFLQLTGDSINLVYRLEFGQFFAIAAGVGRWARAVRDATHPSPRLHAAGSGLRSVMMRKDSGHIAFVPSGE
jgi:hypothetical protein